MTATTPGGVSLPDATGPSDRDALRNKLLLLGVAVVALLIAGVGYLFWASGRAEEDLATREARAQEAIEAFETEPDLGAAVVDESDEVEPSPEDSTTDPETATEPLLGDGEVLVVNRVPGDDYGRLAVRHVDGTRTLLERRCLRVHIAADRGVCLARDEAVLVPAFRTEFFDLSNPDLPALRSYSSPLPSRARMSPDGVLATATSFVSGSSYADIGGEAETIVTIDEVDNRRALVGLLQFEVLADDPRYNAADRQFWGLSFEDNDRFWVTGFFGAEPELLRGSVSRRTLELVEQPGSCPSVSPDGKHVVFKETLPGLEEYALVLIDTETGAQRRLGESRSVDDQVEWLDDDTILYALHPEGTEDAEAGTVQPQFDIWMLDIASGAEPELFLPAADSPAVLQP